MSPASRPLILALGASALLHAWLLQVAPGLNPPRGETRRVTISVILHAPAADAPREAESAPAVVKREVIADAVTMAPAVPATAAPAAAPAAVTTVTLSPPAASRPAERTVVPLAGDPTYYTAANLDVYPKASLPDLTGRLTVAAQGEVRALVLIDEAGTVNEVREVRSLNVAGSNAEAESAARALLLATRFSPAQKDGRVVKAQVQVSLKYGAAP